MPSKDPEKRREVARKAAKARWAKTQAKEREEELRRIARIRWDSTHASDSTHTEDVDSTHTKPSDSTHNSFAAMFLDTDSTHTDSTHKPRSDTEGGAYQASREPEPRTPSALDLETEEPEGYSDITRDRARGSGGRAGDKPPGEGAKPLDKPTLAQACGEGLDDPSIGQSRKPRTDEERSSREEAPLDLFGEPIQAPSKAGVRRGKGKHGLPGLRASEAIAAWCDLWKEHRGERYVVSGPESHAAKELAKDLGDDWSIDEVKRRAANLITGFGGKDAFRANRASLRALRQDWNNLRERAAMRTLREIAEDDSLDRLRDQLKRM